MKENATQIPLFDCYLIAHSGRRFPSDKGLLATKSRVLKDMIAGSQRGTTAESGERIVEIRLVEDSDEEVELLWALLHDKLQLDDELRAVRREDPASWARAGYGARMADKYRVGGQPLAPDL